MSASTPAAWGSARAAARGSRRAQANARIKRGVTGADIADPLAKPRIGRLAGLGTLAGIVLAALFSHAVVLAGFYGVSTVFARAKAEDPRNRPIELTVIEPPPPPPEPVPEPEPEPEPETEPAKPKPKPKPKPKKTRPPPPPEPVDIPPEPPPPPKKPVRRIVGLSMQSTVKGGSGPSFGVGNTRMGRTADKADDPTETEVLPKGPVEASRSNRTASRLPIGLGSAKVVKPRYAGPRLEPPYPDDYRAQNLEARITVEVRIGPDGRVTKARIVRGSPFARFEEAALRAARRQRWVPAKRSGKAIAWTLTYTYAFTLKD